MPNCFMPFFWGAHQLSQKSGWVSEDGNVYVIYTIRQSNDQMT